MYLGDTNIEITTREVVIALIFAIISLGIGFYVGNRMGIWQDEHNAKYNQAVRIDNDSTQFAYAFKTNVGHTLAYGTVEAIGSVTDNGLGGEYMSIHRVLEVYTMHSRLVCTGSGKTRSCHTQIYWTWDYNGAKDWAVNEVKFLGKTFRFGTFPELPEGNHVKTINFAPHKRYVYYCRHLRYTGTVYANIDNHVMNDGEYRDGVTIDMAVDEFSWKHVVLYFWLIFSAVILLICCIFIALDNDWLNN
jgi:hypothetical protein